MVRRKGGGEIKALGAEGGVSGFCYKIFTRIVMRSEVRVISYKSMQPNIAFK